MRKIFLYFLACFILTSCDNLKKKDAKTDDEEETTTKKKKKPLEEDETTDDETTKTKKNTTTDYETPEDDNKKEDRDDKDPIVVTTTLDEDGKLRGQVQWSNADRQKFLDECVGAANKNLGEKRANEYCNCFLEKLEKKYTSYQDAGKMTQAELKNWAAECNGQ